MTEITTRPGNWSPYQPLSVEDQQRFDHCMDAFAGRKLTPTAVSTRTNRVTLYRFQCNTRMNTPNGPVEKQLVLVIAQSPGQPPQYVTLRDN